MVENNTNPGQEKAEEIDLRELFNLIGRAFKGLGNRFLRLFIFFKINFFKLLGLIFLGLVIGYALNQLITKKYKTEIIVKPNFDSKEYLYEVVGEIQSKLTASDTTFFKSLGLKVEDLRGFSVKISPVENEDENIDNTKRDTDYLKVLQDYKENEFVIDAVRLEILKKIIFTHRITFNFKNLEKGEESSRILLNYINSNPYYYELHKVYRKNAESRIQNNNELITQIDNLIEKYASRLDKGNYLEHKQPSVLFDGDEPLDATGLLTFKNKLIQEIEESQIRLAELENPISVINFGKARKIETRFFTNATTLVPLTFIILFFLWIFFQYLNRKSNELI